MRRTTKFRARSSRKAKDLIWWTNVLDLTVNDVAASFTQLMTAAEWSAVPSISFERATLLRIVGNIVWQTTTSPTVADGTACNLVIVKDNLAAPAVDPTNLATVNTADVLKAISLPILGATSSNISFLAVDVVTKRKLTSEECINLCGRCTADAGVPVVRIRGILRFLINRL